MKQIRATRLAKGLADIWLTDGEQKQIRDTELHNLAKGMGIIREHG